MSFNTTEYFNRDLSWLRFNHRVLQEAADKRNTLYERIKFLAIFSSNLDEFFKVRISSIRQIKSLDKSLRKKLISKPNKLLKEILHQVNTLQDEFGNIYRGEILPELKKNGISIILVNEMTEDQKAFALKYYQDHVASDLTQKSDFSSNNDSLFVENEELYVFSIVNHQLYFVKIPNGGRFIKLPEDKSVHTYVYIDDILKLGLYEQHKSDFYSLKVSRDAELYIDDEFTGNLKDKIDNALSRRETGQITRALLEKNTPDIFINTLSQQFDINETDIIIGGDYHRFSDFFGFPNPIGEKLEAPNITPIQNKELATYDSMFEALKEKDRVLYFPYESFTDVLRLVEEAANDDHVTVIKMTLYRVSKDSVIANSLVKALENGKKVVVFIETKARFDEANNIKWGHILEEEGATVIYSLPAVKVHSKILYIEREIEDQFEQYCYIGTGNFNEKTSKIYTDFGMMSARKSLTKDLAQVFYLLESRIIYPRTKSLLVSPFSTRTQFEKMVENEISHAKEGKEAYIILKMNALQDQEMIDLLYKANNAGVKIQLIVRGMCCLVPGIKGQSENISIISLIGQFLEHARVYIFANDGKEKMYIGSADWMTRNLDNRIEVITPIKDKDCYQKIRNIVQLQLDDNVKARIIGLEQSNTYVSNHNTPLNAQLEIYKYLQKFS